jgi:hypothetical protein
MFTEIVQAPNQRLYRYRSLLLNVHWHGFELDHFRTIGKACTQLVREHKQMSSIIVMRGEFNFSLTPEARKAGAALTKEFAGTNTGQAILVEAAGFRASLARSLITGVNMLSGSRSRQRVFQDARETVTWLCALDNQPPEIRDGGPQIWDAFQKLLGDLPT